MNSYVEQLVVHKRNYKDVLVSLVMILSIFAVLALGFILGVLINLYFVAVGAFLTAFDIYFCWYVITGRNVEYEYTVTNNNLQIDKVMAKRRRKDMLSIDINKIDGFDKWSENRLNDDKCDKVFYFGIDEYSKEQYRFIVVTNKYGRIMVVFAPNDKVLNAIKMHLKPEVKIELLKNSKK